MSDTGCITEWGDTASWADQRGCLLDQASGRQCGLDPGPDPNPRPPDNGGNPGDPGTLPAPWTYVLTADGPGEISEPEGYVLIWNTSADGLDIRTDLANPSNYGRIMVLTQGALRRSFTIEDIITVNPDYVRFGGPFIETDAMVEGDEVIVSIESSANPAGAPITISAPAVKVGQNISGLQINVVGFVPTWTVGQTATVHIGAKQFNTVVTDPASVSIVLGDTNAYPVGTVDVWVTGAGAPVTQATPMVWSPWDGVYYLASITPNFIDTLLTTPLVLDIIGTGLVAGMTFSPDFVGGVYALIDPTHATVTIANPSDSDFAATTTPFPGMLQLAGVFSNMRPVILNRSA